MLATATYHARARRPRPEKLRPAKQIMLAAKAANRTQRIRRGGARDRRAGRPRAGPLFVLLVGGLGELEAPPRHAAAR